MRWRVLQAGRVYVRQHPEDARLSVDELCDMVCTSFSSRVCHYAGSLRGTRPYWMKLDSHGQHTWAPNCFFFFFFLPTVLLTFSGHN